MNEGGCIQPPGATNGTTRLDRLTVTLILLDLSVSPTSNVIRVRFYFGQFMPKAPSSKCSQSRIAGSSVPRPRSAATGDAWPALSHASSSSNTASSEGVDKLWKSMKARWEKSMVRLLCFIHTHCDTHGTWCATVSRTHRQLPGCNLEEKSPSSTRLPRPQGSICASPSS